jgi:hypothetical protein
MGCGDSKSQVIPQNSNKLKNAPHDQVDLDEDLRVKSELEKAFTPPNARPETSTPKQNDQNENLFQLGKSKNETLELVGEYDSSEFDEEDRLPVADNEPNEDLSSLNDADLVLKRAGPSDVYELDGKVYQKTELLNDTFDPDLNLNYDAEPVLIQQEDQNRVDLNQKVFIRYLQPIEPRTPSPNIIFERQATPKPALDPIRIREVLEESRQPTPLLIRELPPNKPQIEPKKPIEIRVLSAPSPPPRQVILERVYEPEPLGDIIIEVI